MVCFDIFHLRVTKTSRADCLREVFFLGVISVSFNFHYCVGYEARTNLVGLSRHHVLVSGLNHCVPLLSLFISI